MTHLYRDSARAFVETLVVRCGLADASPETRAETVAALTLEAQRRVGLELMRRLDEHSLGYFNSLIQRGVEEEELAAFFRVRVPDAEASVERALASFGEECLRSARRIDEAVWPV